MVVEELYLIAEWAQREIVDKYIENKYQDLINILNENLQPHNQKRPFEHQRDELLLSISNVYLENLSEEQKKILAKLGIFDNIGNQGIQKIEDTLYRNALDLATVVNKLNYFKDEINRGVSKLNQVKEGLDGVFDKEETKYSNENLVSIHFEDKTVVDNIMELNVRTDNWCEILKGIALLQEFPLDEVRISTQSGDSFILTLTSENIITKTILELNSKILNVIEKIVDIMKKVQEIKNLNLSNKQIEIDLEREADKLRKESIEKISREITMGKNINGEVQRNVEKSIRLVFEFIENGGRIVGTIPAENEQSETEIQAENY